MEPESDWLEYDIMTRFPLLSASEDLKRWSGFMATKPRAIRISLVIPEFPICKDAYLNNEDMDDKAVDYWEAVLENVSLSDDNTLLEFLIMVEEQLFTKLELNGKSSKTDNPALYGTVIEEIEKIGTKNVVRVSPDFSELIIKVDRSEREHLLKLNIPSQYPEAQPKVIAELPVNDNFIWPKRIPEIYKTFINCIDKFRKFWNDMDDLDSRIRVVEPFLPNRSHYHRKILLQDNVIVHLIFDPEAPRAFPNINFSGPENLVESYTTQLDREFSSWDENDRVIQNLRGILSCDFVPREHDDPNEEDELTPCTICYVYNFDDEIPEMNCECGAVYHQKCLNDLLANNVGNINHNRYVECPNCQIELKIPTKVSSSVQLGNW